MLQTRRHGYGAVQQHERGLSSFDRLLPGAEIAARLCMGVNLV